MTRTTTILCLFASGALLCAGTALAADPPKSPIEVKVPSALQSRAKAPVPPATAKKGTALGKGDAKVNSSNSPGDTDFVWDEQLDIDGDGNAEQSDLLWDDEDKVLYLYADGTFPCTAGGTGTGGLVMALYGEGNSHHRPVGSGWYAVELDEGQCAADNQGLVGCRFDEQGKTTACGTVDIDDETDDLVIGGPTD